MPRLGVIARVQILQCWSCPELLSQKVPIAGRTRFCTLLFSVYLARACLKPCLGSTRKYYSFSENLTLALKVFGYFLVHFTVYTMGLVSLVRLYLKWVPGMRAALGFSGFSCFCSLNGPWDFWKPHTSDYIAQACLFPNKFCREGFLVGFV